MNLYVMGACIALSIVVLSVICAIIMSVGLDDVDNISTQRKVISILLSIFMCVSGTLYLSHQSHKVDQAQDNKIKNAQMHNGTITWVDINDEYYKINLKNKGITYRFDEEHSKISRNDLHDVIKKQNQAKVKYKIFNDDKIIIIKIEKSDN